MSTTFFSAIVCEIQLSVGIFGTEIAYRDTGSIKREQELNPFHAAQLCGLTGGDLTELVKLGGRERLGIFRKLLRFMNMNITP